MFVKVPDIPDRGKLTLLVIYRRHGEDRWRVWESHGDAERAVRRTYQLADNHPDFEFMVTSERPVSTALA